MQTIWKFILDPKDPFNPNEVIKVKMPTDAEILCVQAQHDEICIWAKCTPRKPSEPFKTRCFEVFGTGHSIPDEMFVQRSYIGTVQLENGSLVFHVFERVDL